jgi:predicted DsbA family dithiol-disulfide isomerase
MDNPFFIEVWSDVVCPFCYLGSRQLALALERFDHRGEIVVHRRAFELDASAELDPGVTLDVLLATKYALPVERAQALNERLEHQAHDLGMTWSMRDARPTNTFDAHRLIALASSQGLADEMCERLFLAYFSEGQLIGDRACLARLAREVGVDGADDLWIGGNYVDEVRADESRATELGITGVPTILVNDMFVIVGAQGVDQMLDVLERAWRRRDAQSSSSSTRAAVATE